MQVLPPLAILLLTGSLLTAADVPVAPAEDPLALPPAGEEADPTSAAAWDTRLFDKKGKLIRAAYVRAAASMEAKDLDHRLGPNYDFFHPAAKKPTKESKDSKGTKATTDDKDKADKKPTAKDPGTIDGFPLDAPRYPNGRYIWKEPTKNGVDWTGHGGQVIFLPEQPGATGMDKVSFCWTVHENHGGKQFWHDYTMRPGIGEKDGGQWWSGSPDPALRSQNVIAAFGKDPNRTPSAIARGRCAWANYAMIAFRNGLITMSGTGNNGDHGFLTVQLPSGKIPTAIAVTPGNEMALVAVWDVNELKGQMGMIALGSNRDHQLMLIPNTAFFTRMKLLGFIDLPIATPSAISATTDTVSSDGVSGDLAKDAFDLSKPEIRERWAKGAPGVTRNVAMALPRCGYAVITSRAENKAVFVDLGPFFTWLRTMYLGTQQDYDATTKRGDAPDQWPFTFEHASKAKPVVVHTLKIPQPTAVAAGFPTGDDASFATKAMIATLDGRLVVVEVGQLASSAAKPGPITPLGMVAVGRNPTGLCYGARQVQPNNQVVVVSRGDRRISWVRIASTTPTVTRTLEDSRFNDPVAVEAGDYRGGKFVCIADFKGRRLINYLTAPIDSWGDKLYGGLGVKGDAAFECAGFTTVPGYPFLISGAEVP
jgi:hypothetical protein